MTAVPMLVALALLAVLLLLLLEVLIDREEVAAGLVLGLVVLSATLPGDVTSTSVGGLRVSVSDAGYGLVAAAALARYLRLRRFTPAQRMLVVLAMMLLISLGLGATEAVPSAFNELRGYLGFASAALYFSTMPTDRETRQRVGRVWLWTGCAIAIVILLRWMNRFGGIPIGVLDARYDAAIRVLNGPETFMVAHIALIALLPGLEGGQRRVWEGRLGVLLLLMAIMLNRRTVWLTLAVVLLALLVRSPAVGRRAVAAAVVGLFAFTFAVPYLPGSAGEDRPAAQTVTNTGTLIWRVEGWSALLSPGPDGPFEVAVGQPFGRGYTREVAGSELESTPHNFYIQTFLRTGTVGVSALLIAMWLSLAATARREGEDGGLLARNTLFLLMLTQAVWFVTWAPGADQGIVLGLAVAYARDDFMCRRGVGGLRTATRAAG